MTRYIIAIDQSTQSTKLMLFSPGCELIRRVNMPHRQYYPRPGWVEHDAEEIYRNTLKAAAALLKGIDLHDVELSLAITNQRETAVVWDSRSGKPICNAVVWQCLRGQQICEDLVQQGCSEMVRQKSGLLIDPYFSASGVKWILDNVEGARQKAQQGQLLMGTMDSWLIWKLTGGAVHATDFTNASRTMLFNIHTLDWDDDLLRLFTIPRSMMPRVLPCDSIFGQTNIEGLLLEPVQIAGVLGDSHGALVGQMCFEEGMGKATYGTGSSVMVNIGQKVADAPSGLVTSVGYAALGKVFYAFEGNIHCTGATISWLEDKMEMISSPSQIEPLATSVPDNGGVYLVPAFAGLAAPWWNPEVKAAVFGMTLGTTKAHLLRAALESIAYQVDDLVTAMTSQAGIALKELCADGGPTANKFLMQFQADLLQAAINRSEIEEASALGAVIMNGFATGLWNDFAQPSALRKRHERIECAAAESEMCPLKEGWRKAVLQLLK